MGHLDIYHKDILKDGTWLTPKKHVNGKSSKVPKFPLYPGDGISLNSNPFGNGPLYMKYFPGVAIGFDLLQPEDLEPWNDWYYREHPEKKPNE